MAADEKYTILIIEDGTFYQKELHDTLAEYYHLLVAESGKQALDILLKTRPHLILLDIVLPDISGFELLSIIKEMEPVQDIPVMIITGLDSENDEEKGLLLGAVDYIRKPFNHTIVRARVRTQMQIIKHIETIEQLSFLDALTALPNRRKFDYQIEYEWNRAVRKQTQISLLLVDLDFFKQYNDTYGHSQGDVMLQTVAKVMRGTIQRSTDIPCRWGGEEFAILLPETSLQEAVDMAENLRLNIEKTTVPSLKEGQSTHITISIGVASMVPKDKESLSTLVEKADALLYVAKENGRNQVRF